MRRFFLVFGLCLLASGGKKTAELPVGLSRFARQELRGIQFPSLQSVL